MPAFAPARAQYGPGVLARAAELLCGHYLPVARATRLMASMLGATVSTMVTYMFPVVGVTLGVVVLGEVLDARLILGAALVVLGIAIVGLRYDAVVSLATRVARR